MIEYSTTKLDLRFNGKLDPHLSLLFNSIAMSKRASFNEVVSMLSEPNIKNIDWWVEGPASRNTSSSPLFHRYCCLYLVFRLIEEDKFTFREVIVDSKEFSNILEQIFDDKLVMQIFVRFEKHNNYFDKTMTKRIMEIPFLFCKIFFRCLVARLTRHLSSYKIPLEPLVLIDTFMLPNYTNSDRWYGILWDNLSDNQKRETFFVPTIVMTPIISFHKVFKQLRRSKKNFLIKEDYITVADIIYASCVRWRLKNIVIGSRQVEGYDISGMVKEELLNNRDMLTVIESLLTYRFIKRLSHKSFKIKESIDWFEGFAIDKAWSLGFRHFFPNSRHLGFRAFESYPFYLSSFPIPIEKKAGVIPEIFAVQGKGTIETLKEFIKDMDVVVIPSIRSQHVWDKISVSHGKKVKLDFVILVTLPIGIYTANKILKQLSKACGSINQQIRRIQFIIKPHPAGLLNEGIINLIMQLPSYISIDNKKSFPELIREADLLISEASSTCLEALACGVPVIVVENDEGLTHNPFPQKISKNMYRNIRSVGELCDEINYFVNRPEEMVKKQKIDGKWVRNNYFEPFTFEGFNRLFCP